VTQYYVFMGHDHLSFVSAEIQRLEKNGWKDWSLDVFNVKASLVRLKSEISFPEDWYKADATNIEANEIWAKARANLILENLIRSGNTLLWEVGAGNGNVAIPLKKAGITVIGIEPLRTGALALTNNGITAYWGTLEDLAFPDKSIEAIGIFDVLEHLEYPELVLCEVQRVLKPGGLLITTVPANQWLFSDFDLSIGHFRRYSRKSLRRLLTENGFVSNRIEYFFLSLVLPAFILRTIPYKLGRRKVFQSQVRSNSGLNKVMRCLEPLLKAIFAVERKLPLPLGLSLISCSYKSD
jgi:ubiquinone/menaquinone biosynthesis C-methylase UbiE